MTTLYTSTRSARRVPCISRRRYLADPAAYLTAAGVDGEARHATARSTTGATPWVRTRLCSEIGQRGEQTPADFAAQRVFDAVAAEVAKLPPGRPDFAT